MSGGSSRRVDPLQFSLEFRAPAGAPSARTAEELLERLRMLGLKGIARLRLTQNRAVMVSFGRGLLRVHRGYLGAPMEVHEAIVAFVCGRSRAERREAQRIILGYPVHTRTRPPVRRHERPRTEDELLLRALRQWHGEYNELHFRGALAEIPLRISSRMRSRLGQYTAASPYGEPAEIAIGRHHIRVHGWEEVLHTLLHEMVHQWQAENGHPIDHGRIFRQKAREVGIAPTARREIAAGRRGRHPHPLEVLRQAARKG
ncbi:MAG TPA: SprT-like domain-containing protein [Gemmatimonadaceae bacterium]|nr:SprT-like domain-containing protein [Gemmatimonadaceae bacterium]